MEAYMRQQFSFLGIAAPERNALYRKYFPSEKKTKIIDWDFVDTCWEKEPREYQYVGANYLKAMQVNLLNSSKNPHGLPSDAERHKIRKRQGLWKPICASNFPF